MRLNLIGVEEGVRLARCSGKKLSAHVMVVITTGG
jgi:hypothetical protein